MIFQFSYALVAAFALAELAFAAPETERPTPVVAKALQAESLSDVLTYPARVVSAVDASVLAEGEGQVQKISVRLGDAVKAGQLLFVVRNTDTSYNYAPLQVTAPLSGVIGSLEVTEGTQVFKGQKLASLMDPARVRITLEVPVSDLPKLRVGAPAQFSSTDVSSAQSLKLVGLSPVIDPATGTASAQLERVGKGSLKLVPGQLGQVRFDVNPRQGISVAEDAIIYKGKDTFVRLIREGKARHVAVKLGRSSRGTVEVLSGLKDKDLLIERSSGFVGDGENVEVQSESPRREAVKCSHRARAPAEPLAKAFMHPR